jgi:hypothetical protein
LPPLQNGEGGGLGDCSDDGGGDEFDGELPEGEGGLEDGESSESEGGVDLELSELGDGGGLDQPFELGDELEPESELESLGGGALESLSLLLSSLLLLLPLPLLFSSLDDEELGDGAISDMLSFSDAPALLDDPSWYYVPLLRKSSSCFSGSICALPLNPLPLDMICNLQTSFSPFSVSTARHLTSSSVSSHL